MFKLGENSFGPHSIGRGMTVDSYALVHRHGLEAFDMLAEEARLDVFGKIANLEDMEEKLIAIGLACVIPYLDKKASDSSAYTSIKRELS